MFPGWWCTEASVPGLRMHGRCWTRNFASATSSWAAPYLFGLFKSGCRIPVATTIGRPCDDHWSVSLSRQNAQNLQKDRSYADWREAIEELLSAAEWSLLKATDSAEYQLLRRWNALLNEFSSLSAVTGSVPFSDAIKRLKSLAGDDAVHAGDTKRARTNSRSRGGGWANVRSNMVDECASDQLATARPCSAISSVECAASGAHALCRSGDGCGFRATRHAANLDIRAIGRL